MAKSTVKKAKSKTAKSKAKAGNAKGKKMVNSTAEKAKKALKDAKKKFAAIEKTARQKIKEDPETAVAIAAGIGAALGAIATKAWNTKNKKSGK